MAIETSCGALVIHIANGKKKILLIKNKGGDYWGFPKGHMEEGETLEETALREIKEETGLGISLRSRFRGQTSYPKENGNIKNVTYFIADTENPDVEIQEAEISGYKWLPYNECLEKLTYKRDKNILQEAEKYI